MLEMKPGLPVHFMAGAAFLFIIFFFVDLVLLLEAEELDEQQQLALLTAVKVIQQAYHGSSRKRMHFNDDNDEDNADSPPTKKKYTRYDRERAHRCVMQDYLGPMPIFDDSSSNVSFGSVAGYMRPSDASAVLRTVSSRQERIVLVVMPSARM